MADHTFQVGDTEIELTSVVNKVSAYNLIVDVVRMTKVRSPEGMSEESVTIVNQMPCGIIWLSGKEKILFNKETHVLDGILSCRKPAGVTITNSDKFFYNEETYEITDVEDVNNLGVLLRISIKKIK